MCILVISDYSDVGYDPRLAQISREISDLVCSARIESRSIAFLQRKGGSGFGALGLRIGRYDPIFILSDRGDFISDGLVEFILRHSVQPIQLAGVATAPRVSRLEQMFRCAGLAVQIAPRCALILDTPANANQAHQHSGIQLSEYGPFVCDESACAASRKNQSTR